MRGRRGEGTFAERKSVVSEEEGEAEATRIVERNLALQRAAAFAISRQKIV